MLVCLFSVYGRGSTELELKNVQEINLENIDSITIRYSSDDITLFKSNSDMLILREYFSKDNREIYARISTSANELLIRAGERSSIHVGMNFRSRIEVFIPDSNKNISIMTSSGDIRGNDEHTVSTFAAESSSGDMRLNSVNAGNVSFTSSSGRIRCERVSGNTSIRSSSGDIFFDAITGDTSARSSSGNIEIKQISGSLTANSSSGDMKLRMTSGELNAESSSGGIQSSLTLNTRGVSITTTSGDVRLKIPQNLAFNFFYKTSSGSIRTPFNDNLSSPLSDRKSIRGIINGENLPEDQRININIRTSSGSLKASWVN
jgi:DUF4097 and DUF4098 domain-containing protein YvlB